MRSVATKSAFASAMDAPSANAKSHKPSRLLHSSAEAAIAAHTVAITVTIFILCSTFFFQRN
jgi:hypothetical protein